MIIIGVEFGQRRNPSAICVATNQLRSLERPGVGTTFPALATGLTENRSP